MDDPGPTFFIGHHDPKRPLPVTSITIQDAHAANYDMLTCPITTPYFHSRVLSLLSASLAGGVAGTDVEVTNASNASPIVIPPLSPADTPLTPDESISQIIGITSTWIDLGSLDPLIADVSRQVLKLELTYAAFCGITYVIIPGPRLKGREGNEHGFIQYARSILDSLSQGPYMQFYIWMPMLDHSDNDLQEMGDLAPFARQHFMTEQDSTAERLDLFGTWEAWNTIRSICRYSTRLGVALSLPKLLPPIPIQSRWYSEPVRILSLDSNIFARNAKDYPVLSKAHQALITRFVRARSPPWFLLCNVGPVPSTTDASHSNHKVIDLAGFPTISESNNTTYQKDSTPHLSYMRNLQTKQPPQTDLDRFGSGYQDYLQAPLQPLTVNLESITYEVFEKDPIKYDWYERAIARALHDWIEQGKSTSNPDGRVVVAVVGAGRGPLVTRALKASEDVGVDIDMWALEKNPNAFVLLQRHNEFTWGHRVNLVKSDMRTWRGPTRKHDPNMRRTFNIELDENEEELDPNRHVPNDGQPATDQSEGINKSFETTNYKIDILISELLGSFADNELSPECLDGVQHLLNPEHGISIPASYTAHLTPIAAPRLHADISLSMTPTNPTAAEIPYVVMFNAIDYLSTTTTSNPSQPDQTTSTIPEPPIPRIETAWSFHHPNPSLPPTHSPNTTSLPSQVQTQTQSNIHINPTLTNAHNARHTSLTFPIPNRGTCHGLAGYFETILYPGVELSTNPNTMAEKSEDMISWFPIYFPLKTPLYAPDSSSMVVNMWRRTDDRQVWYEWIVDVFIDVPYGPSKPFVSSTSGAAAATAVADDTKGKGKDSARTDGTGSGGQPRGTKRARIGGSELHSSEKEACLM